jgi:hypothetical protein
VAILMKSYTEGQTVEVKKVCESQIDSEGQGVSITCDLAEIT